MPEGCSTSERVIAAVAEEIDRDPTEVGPLYHVVDPDALDRLFSPTARGVRTDGHVQFVFAGCDVLVRGDGEVEVSRRRIGDGGAPDRRPSDSDADR